MTKMTLRRPLFRRSLYVSDSPYFLQRNQEDGEKDLAKLAKKAKREDSWIFVKKDGVWLHLRNEHEERKMETGVKFSTSMPLISSLNGNGESLTHYHIHPDEFHREFFRKNPELKQLGLPESWARAFFSLPSEEDIKTSLTIPNYSFKIATSRGITSFKSLDQRASGINLNDLLLKELERDPHLFQQERYNCLGEVFSRINRKTSHLLELSYKPVY